jgi:16S rRNA (cytosine(1402)-N(4))-methyltransferase
MVNEVLAFLRCRSSGDEGKEKLNNEQLNCNNGDDRVLENESRIFIDATLGTAGHTLEILRSDERSRVIAFDRDAESMKWARRRIEDENLLERVALVQSDFRFAPQCLEKLQEAVEVQAELQNKPHADASAHLEAFDASATNLENSEADSQEGKESIAVARVLFVGKEFLKPGEALVGNIAGALIDAGMSMFQVAWEERGLSFQKDAPLDMRYDRTRGLSASDLVNRLSQQELEDLFFKFTDERWARRIAAVIEDHRRRQVINTTSELVSLIEAAIPFGVRRSMRVHPATRVFAALRLAVNDEFWALEEGAWACSSVLAPAARLIILTYSSNEDRTVKRTFRRLAARPSPDEYSRQEATALSTPQRASSMRSPLTFSRKEISRSEISPDEFSLAVPTDMSDLAAPDFLAPYLEGFAKSWRMKIVTNKPVEPGEDEVANNPLSRSCKLRAVEKFVVAS